MSTEVRTRRERGGHVRLLGEGGVGREQARADVDDQRHAEVAEVGGRDGRGEAAHHEVRRVHLEDERGGVVDRAGVVVGVHAVGRADLAQARRGGFNKFRQAEPRTDFNELAARDDDLLARGQRGRGQQ